MGGSLLPTTHDSPNLLWKHIIDQISPGGFLVADLPHLPKAELFCMLKDFDIPYFEETMELYSGQPAVNELPTYPKTYAVIARKR